MGFGVPASSLAASRCTLWPLAATAATHWLPQPLHAARPICARHPASMLHHPSPHSSLCCSMTPHSLFPCCCWATRCSKAASGLRVTLLPPDSPFIMPLALLLLLLRLAAPGAPPESADAKPCARRGGGGPGADPGCGRGGEEEARSIVAAPPVLLDTDQPAPAKLPLLRRDTRLRRLWKPFEAERKLRRRPREAVLERRRATVDTVCRQ